MNKTIKTTERVEWDDEVKGLGKRIRGTNISWILQARVDGKSRKKTLGGGTEISLEIARALARDQLDAWEHGDIDQQGDTTIKAFSTLFLRDCAGQWKPGTIRGHRNNTNFHIIPHLGAMKLNEIDQQDIINWREHLDVSEATRNRAMAVLSGMYRHAEILGICPAGSNPCKGLRKRSSGFKALYLSDDDYLTLGRALIKHQETHLAGVALIRFLALTGCRLGEAHHLRWDQIEGNRVILPDSKTGPRVIWLGKRARKALAPLPRVSEFVFFHKRAVISTVILYRLWHGIRDEIGHPTMRLHDLRHSFASKAVRSNIGLKFIGGLLGHSEIATTAAYAHLDEAPIRAASDRVGAHINKALNGTRRRAAT